jgi:LAO/AO transport system kinase
MSASVDNLLSDFDAGRRVALARVISLVENQRSGFRNILHELHRRLGRAHRIGITGPPGAGKSTLTAVLIAHYRARGERVGVIAVDPTSPFTGGALLGDRIRMNESSLDEGVFIRSMATRGSIGGLAVATSEVADVMDAFGFQRVLVETVGVGQSELAIAAAADATVVVLVPESGDAIQAMKAGLMEAADLFVINKADRPGADRLARDLRTMLHLRTGRALRGAPAHHGVDLGRAGEQKAPQAPAEATSGDTATHAGWEVPVLQTVANAGTGVAEVAEALEQHRAWLADSGELSRRRQQRLAERVREEVGRVLLQRTWHERGGLGLMAAAMPDLENGRVTPYEVAARIVRALGT